MSTNSIAAAATLALAVWSRGRMFFEPEAEVMPALVLQELTPVRWGPERFWRAASIAHACAGSKHFFHNGIHVFECLPQLPRVFPACFRQIGAPAPCPAHASGHLLRNL